MRIKNIENENLDESVQVGDIVSFEFGDKLAVEGLVVETEDGLAVELDEQGEQYLTELIPLAIAAGGLAWSAYDAYNAYQQLQRGEITQSDLAAQVGTDIALSVAGGGIAKAAGKGFKAFRKWWKGDKGKQEPTLPRDMGPAPTGPNGRPLSPMSGREEPPMTSRNTPNTQRKEPPLTRKTGKDNDKDSNWKRTGAGRLGLDDPGSNTDLAGFVKRYGPNAQRGRMNDDVQRLRTLSGLTEEYLVEGTWALPDTMEKAKEIASLMNNPIPVEKASDLMYSLIGDDELFDLFGELEDDGTGTDARPTIARWIADNMDLIAANVDDQEVIKALADVAELHESEQQVEETESFDFGMFTPGGDAQVQNIIQYTLNDFEDEAEKANNSERDALRMEAMQKLFKELEDLAEDPKHEEAMDTDVRERAAAYLDKGIVRIMNMLDNQPVSEEEIEEGIDTDSAFNAIMKKDPGDEGIGYVFDKFASKMTDQDADELAKKLGEFYPDWHEQHYQEEELDEAEYQGRKVKLGKPTRGDVKKFKVYVKNDKGNVVKVNFGHKGKGNEKTMRIKKSDPKRRKSFRARHNCDNPGPRWKARYWSCRAW